MTLTAVTVWGYEASTNRAKLVESQLETTEELCASQI